MNATFEFSAFVDRLAGPAGLKLSLALLHFLWQGVLIAAGASTLMRVFGRRSSSRRYAIGVAGMALMAVAPVVTFCVVTPPEPVRTELAETAREDLLFEIERLEGLLGEARTGAEETREAENEIAEVAPLTWPERVRLWQPYALLAWLGGTGLFALRLGFGVRASRQFGRGRRPLPEAWLKIAIEVAGTLGIRTPRVFVSDRVVEAVAVGLLRPMVLIPAAWLGRVPPEVLEAVLAHELAHLRRYDLWVNLLQRCVEAALFYHPAVWWLSRRVRVEREYCCDETAATAVSGRAAYARALEFAATEAAAARRVATARPMIRGTALAAGMGGEPMALLDRVRRVLGADAKPPRGSWMSEGLLALAVPAALWAGIAAVGPAVAEAGSGGAGEREREGQEEDDAAQGEGPADVLIYRDVEGEEGRGIEEVEGDLLIYRDVLEEHPEGLGPEPVRVPLDEERLELSVRVPMLDKVPFVGRLFRSEAAGEDVVVDRREDVIIARGPIEASDEAEDETEEDADGEDDVREMLRELRAEMRALRGEVEELRGRTTIKRDLLREVRPFPPEGPRPPHPPKPPMPGAKFDGPHGDHGPHKPQVFIKEFRGDGKGPERFEVRVFKDQELKGPGPEKFLKRLDIEKVDGKPKVFFFREGKDGKPERVEGKPKGEESVIELEEGRIHVRPLPPGKGHGDPRDEVIHRLEDELRRLREELRKQAKETADRRFSDDLRREDSAARRQALDAKIRELRLQESDLEDKVGGRHPEMQSLRKKIELLTGELEASAGDRGTGKGEGHGDYEYRLASEVTAGEALEHFRRDGDRQAAEALRDAERARAEAEEAQRRAEEFASRYREELKAREAEVKAERGKAQEAEERSAKLRAQEEQLRREAEQAKAAAREQAAEAAEEAREVGRFVDKYNELVKQKAFAEAIQIAKQAHEIAPENPTAVTMLYKAKVLYEASRDEEVREQQAEDEEERAEAGEPDEADEAEHEDGDDESGEGAAVDDAEGAAEEAAERAEHEAARAELEATEAEVAAEREVVHAEQKAVEEAEREAREAEEAEERAESEVEQESAEVEASEEPESDEANRIEGEKEAGDEVGREVPAIERAFAFFEGMAR